MELPAEPEREHSDSGAVSMDNSNSSAAKLESSRALAGQNQPPTNYQQINSGAPPLDVSALLQQLLNSSTTASSTPSILSTLAGLQNSSQVQPQPLSAASSAVVPLQFQSMPLQEQAHQISQIPVAASSSLFPQQQLQQLPLLQQLTATNAFAQASTGGQVQLAPQPLALNQLALLQQLASSSTAIPKVEFGTLSSVTAPQAQDSSPQLLQQLIHDNMVKNQTINALLMSQLHTQNTATVQMVNSTNQNQMNALLGNMSANLLASNSGSVAGTTLAGQGQGTVPLPVAAGSSSSSSSGSAYLYLPAEELQEKRWIQRYDELIQFQRVSGSIVLIFFVAVVCFIFLHLLLALHISMYQDIWPLSSAPRLQ